MKRNRTRDVELKYWMEMKADRKRKKLWTSRHEQKKTKKYIQKQKYEKWKMRDLN